MKKNYFIILEKHDNDPIEIRHSESNYAEEKCTIDFERTQEGRFLVGLSAPNMLAAIERALEMRDQAIASGEWDIIGKYYKCAI